MTAREQCGFRYGYGPCKWSKYDHRFLAHQWQPVQETPPAEEPRLIYLASPYSHADPAVMEARFDAVCREAAILMGRGIHVYSPIAHTHPIAVRGELPKDWQFWEAYDNVMIAAASEVWVLMLEGWAASKGVNAEIEIAQDTGKRLRFVEPRAGLEPTPAAEVRADDDWGIGGYAESVPTSPYPFMPGEREMLEESLKQMAPIPAEKMKEHFYGSLVAPQYGHVHASQETTANNTPTGSSGR